MAASPRAEFLLLYGRRRVGKSELIDRFIREAGGIRQLARRRRSPSGCGTSRRCSRPTSATPCWRETPLNWDAFFGCLAVKAKQRLVVALDEFPYLVAANPALPSLLQSHWDQGLRKTKLFLVLCGSSIGMMESLMGARSPLYGRRTGQMLLKPLGFADALPQLGAGRRAVEGYAVFGGTPAYLLGWDRRKSLWANIREKALNPERFLYRDAEFILREKVREPRVYFSTLQPIAKGNTRLGRIINGTGLDKGVVGKYVGILVDLHLVEREVPVTERKPEKSWKGIYRLANNFFRFWFRFVSPHIEVIEQGRQDWLMEKIVRPQMSDLVGPVFEPVVREALWALDSTGRPPVRLNRLGRWWEREQEIDLVCMGEGANLFCEVKWSDGVDGVRVIKHLREKSRAVRLQGRAHFCVAARSFRRRALDALNLDMSSLERGIPKLRKPTFWRRVGPDRLCREPRATRPSAAGSSGVWQSRVKGVRPSGPTVVWAPFREAPGDRPNRGFSREGQGRESRDPATRTTKSVAPHGSFRGHTRPCRHTGNCDPEEHRC